METSGVSLARQTEDFCRRAGIAFAPGCRVLCAVSGGLDSMCLLHLLWQWGERDGFAVCAASFDHGLRPEAAGEVELVRAWCAARGIHCTTGAGDTRAQAQQAGQTLEEAARALRYRFLDETADRLGADWIATAHHAGDQAETILLHLLRGTGLHGLGGILPRRGRLVRPLLEAERAQLEDYAAAHGIPHCEDASNLDIAYTRNFLRHRVLPLLREKNPNLDRALGRAAESLRRDEDYLAAESRRAARELLREDSKGVRVPAAALAALHPSIALRLVQEMAERLSPGTVLPYRQREAVLALAESDRPSGKISLSSRLQAGRVYDMLFLSTARQPMSGLSPAFLRPGERAALSEELWAVCAAVPCPLGPWEEDTLYLAPPPGQSGILLRARAPGDAIRLPGRPRKALKKLFIEARVPRQERERIPVLVLDGQVAAVAGFGCDEHFRPAPGEPSWRVRLEQRPPDREEGGLSDEEEDGPRH